VSLRQGGRGYYYTLLEMSDGRWVKVFENQPLKEVLYLMNLKSDWHWRYFRRMVERGEPGYERYKVTKERIPTKLQLEADYEALRPPRFRPKGQYPTRDDGVSLCGDCPRWEMDKIRKGIRLYGWCKDLMEWTERCDWCRKGAVEGESGPDRCGRAQLPEPGPDAD